MTVTDEGMTIEVSFVPLNDQALIVDMEEGIVMLSKALLENAPSAISVMLFERLIVVMFAPAKAEGPIEVTLDGNEDPAHPNSN